MIHQYKHLKPEDRSGLESMLVNASKRRIQKLLDAMPQGKALMVSASDEITQSRDMPYPFSQNRDFYYLFPAQERGASLVLDKTGDAPKVHAFVKVCKPDHAIWENNRLGIDAVKEKFGFDSVQSTDALYDFLTVLLPRTQILSYPLGNETIQTMVMQIYKENAIKRGGMKPEAFEDSAAIIASMRLYKDETEQAIMKAAGRISMQAHQAIMKHLQSGVSERAMKALFEYICELLGAEGVAYETIAASGVNACTLHYIQYQSHAQDGELLLVDAGASLLGYASDITRTVPVSGRFSALQKDVYDLVLESKDAAFDAAKLGAPYSAMHEAAARALASGLVDMKLLKGSLEAVMQTQSYKKFFMHGTGHYLGLDTHDAGSYTQKDAHGKEESIKLAEGMVFTIEPGLYFSEDAATPKELWGMGIRIEDNIIMQPQGAENITKDLAVSTQEIEALMHRG